MTLQRAGAEGALSVEEAPSENCSRSHDVPESEYPISFRRFYVSL